VVVEIDLVEVIARLLRKELARPAARTTRLLHLNT
jgi:hypothetical protein